MITFISPNLNDFKLMVMQKLLIFSASVLIVAFYCAFKPFSFSTLATNGLHHPAPASGIKTGAEQTEKYLLYLKGKRIGVLANPTSIIGTTHLVDSLKARASIS
jgi:hypothetical protein